MTLIMITVFLNRRKKSEDYFNFYLLYHIFLQAKFSGIEESTGIPLELTIKSEMRNFLNKLEKE